MQDIRDDSRRGESHSASEVVGFFYSPVNVNPSSSKRISKSRKHRHPVPEFAQTNFRLVLKSICNYANYLYNPDLTVNWDDVFSIECYVDEMDCCPICLMPFSVPRATKCGHIFCYSCIMYYLRQQEDEWVKCPMCGEYFDNLSLRPVRVLPAKEPICENKSCTMELVARERGVVNGFSASLDNIETYLNAPFPLADSPEQVTQFCHLLRYSPQYELKNLEHDLKDIDASLASMNSAGEVLLIGALQVIKEDIQGKIQTLQSFVRDHPQSIAFVNSHRMDSDILLYYSCPAHLSYHLHPFTLKCLRSQYGDYSDLPPTITSTVAQIEDVEVASGFAAKDPTLHHFPSFTPIHYVELEIRPLLCGRLDERLWKEMKSREMERRRIQRQMKREERKIGRHIEKEEQSFMEQFAPYLVEEPEVKPNTMDCVSFPTLPSSIHTTVEHPPRNAWKENDVLGVNLSLNRSIQKGRFPTLGESNKTAPQQTQPKSTMDWGNVAHASSQKAKSKTKKKSIPLFSF